MRFRPPRLRRTSTKQDDTRSAARSDVRSDVRAEARGVTSPVVPDAATEAVGAAARRGAGKALAWTLLAAGPALAVLIGLTRPTTPASTPTGPNPDNAAEPAGWAELYVQSWLRAARDEDADLATFYPPGMTTDRQPGTQVPMDTTTLSITPIDSGGWSVLVAASVLVLEADGTRAPRIDCLQVTVLDRKPTEVRAEARGAAHPAAYVAAALPSPVTCPATLSTPELNYPGSAETNSALGQSVLGFLTGYLTGRGDLNRYASPGTTIAPITPAPFAAVRLTELRLHDQFDTGQVSRPLEGARTRVLARVAGVDVFGQSTPIDYALSLTARAGRWEVAGIDPAPLVTGQPTPTSATTPPLTPTAPNEASRPPTTPPTNPPANPPTSPATSPALPTPPPSGR